MNDPQFEFGWDEVKAAANARKHGVSFELASTVFRDPRLLTVADLEHSEIEERWFSIGRASNGAVLTIVYLWSEAQLRNYVLSRLAPPRHLRFVTTRKIMNDRSLEDDEIAPEVDFSEGVRGLHHIPPSAKVFLPASIERSVWEYFAGKAEQKGVNLSELLTDVLKRDIEINEALK